MYPVGKHPLFPYSTQDREYILKESNITEKQIEADVDIICEWYSMQPHLPQGYLYRHMIELLIVAAKGSLEKVKRRLDFFFKYRRLAPELIQTRKDTLQDSHIKPRTFIQAPMPKLYNGRRVIVTYYTDSDPRDLSCQEVLTNVMMLTDLRCLNDFMLGDIWIMDLKNCSLAHVMVLNPVLINKAAKFLMEGTGLRVAGIHIINCSMATIMQLVLSLLKPVLSEKLFGRIQFHDNYESLYEYVPKNYLPENYGGDLEDFMEIQEKYERLLKTEDTKDFLIEACKMVSDETVRPKGDKDFILHGTFKKLDID